MKMRISPIEVVAQVGINRLESGAYKALREDVNVS